MGRVRMVVHPFDADSSDANGNRLTLCPASDADGDICPGAAETCGSVVCGRSDRSEGARQALEELNHGWLPESLRDPRWPHRMGFTGRRSRDTCLEGWTVEADTTGGTVLGGAVCAASVGTGGISDGIDSGGRSTIRVALKA